MIDKHTNLATALLKTIKSRQLDAYYGLEEDCVARKAELSAVLAQLQGSMGTPGDKLRLALVWLLTCEAVPSEAECGQVRGGVFVGRLGPACTCPLKAGDLPGTHTHPAHSTSRCRWSSC